MADNDKPIYFGFVEQKEMKGGRNGTWLLTKFSFKIEDAKKHANEKGYVNLIMKEPKDGGKPYFVIDTWKPSGEGRGGGNSGARDVDEHEDREDEDLDFGN